MTGCPRPMLVEILDRNGGEGGDGDDDEGSDGDAHEEDGQEEAGFEAIIKKPPPHPTALFYILEDFRKVYQEEHPDVKSMRDIGKTCGEKWKTMNFEEKVKYYDIATEKRQEFEDAMAAYLKKESGELLKQLDEDYESDGFFD